MSIGREEASPPLSVQFADFSLYLFIYLYIYIIESVDSIGRDEPVSPLTQYITNAGISRARYTITHFKLQQRVLRLISNRISVNIAI